MPPKGTFDAEGFYDALDGARRTRNLTWKQVADQSGVSASTLTRMGQGKRPDVDSLAALVAWARLDADMFITATRSAKRKGDSLAMISTYLRSDPNLSAEAANALDALVQAAYERMRDL